MQEWETRTQLYNSYMKTLMEDLARTSSNPQSVMFYLQILNDQLDVLMMENANSKKICWNVLKEVVPFLQKLSVTYLRQPSKNNNLVSDFSLPDFLYFMLKICPSYISGVSEQILSFFSKIMEVLRQQAGAPFFEESIRGFLALFASENIINDLMKETESSSVVVEKYVKFLIRLPSR